MTSSSSSIATTATLSDAAKKAGVIFLAKHSLSALAIDSSSASTSLLRLRHLTRVLGRSDAKKNQDSRKTAVSYYIHGILLVISVFLALAVATVGFGANLDREIDFVNYDDPMNFKHNPYVRSFRWKHVEWAFIDGNLIGVYEPVANIFKMITASACEASDTLSHSACVHRASFALHVLNIFLVAALSAELVHSTRGERRRSSTEIGVVFPVTLICATLVGVHPQRSEVVVWASSQPYVLACSFVLVSAIAHIRWRRRRDQGRRSSAYFWHALSVLTFTAATLSKAASISCVAVFVCYDASIRLARFSRHTEGRILAGMEWTARTIAILVFDNAALLAVGACTAWTAKQSTGIPAALNEIEAASDLDAPQRWLVAARVVVSYLANQFVEPLWATHRVCARYPLPKRTEVALWNDVVVGEVRRFDTSEYLLATVCVLATTALAVLVVADRIFRSPSTTTSGGCTVASHASMCWLAYLLCLSPTLGVFGSFHVSTRGADRYAYIPSMLCLGPFVSYLSTIAAQRVFAAVVVVRGRLSTHRALLLLAVALPFVARVSQEYALSTQSASATWSTSLLLWSSSARHCPADTAAYSQLGVELLNKDGRRAEAIDMFRKALELEPNFISALLNLGVALEHDGKFHEASEAHLRATRVNAQSFVAWFNAGTVLTRLVRERGERFRAKEAASAMSNAVALNPNDLAALTTLGLLLCDVTAETNKTMRVSIGNGTISYLNDADGLAVLRKAETIAAAADPSFAQNVANCALGLGRQRDAEDAARRALAIRPSHAPSLRTMVKLLQNQSGRVRELESLLERAVTIYPDDAYFCNALAWLSVKLFDDVHYDDRSGERSNVLMRRAAALFESTKRLHPNAAIGWVGESVVAYKTGDYSSCVRALEKALDLEPNNPSNCCKMATCTLHISQLASMKGNIDESERLAKRAREYAERSRSLDPGGCAVGFIGE